MIYKGLNDEEAVFLQVIADSRAKLDAEKRAEENQELLAYRVGKEYITLLSLPLSPNFLSSFTHTHTHTSLSVTRMLSKNLKKKQIL